MTTDLDLRSVLARQAEAVSDDLHGQRLPAVRGRIRTARRRRAALAGGAVAVLMGAVVLGATLVTPRTGRDLPATLAGREVPTVTDSIGYEFRYVRGVTGDHGSVRLNVPATTEPRLVRWASEDDRGRLVFDSGLGDGPWVGPAGDFGDFAFVPAGEPIHGVLRQQGVADPGPVALAVYDLGRAAPGVTDHGITYRQEAEGRHLLGASIAAPGDATNALVVDTAGVRSIQVDAFCGVLAQDRYLELRVSGRRIGRVGCDSIPAPYDAAGSSAHLDLEPSDLTGGIDAHLVDMDGNDVGPGRGGRFGTAVYDTTDAQSLAPKEVEQYGHRWRRISAYTSPRGRTTATLHVEGDGRSLVLWNLSGSTSVTSVTIDGEPVGSTQTPLRSTGTQQRTGAFTTTVRYATPPKGATVLASYRLAD